MYCIMFDCIAYLTIPVNYIVDICFKNVEELLLDKKSMKSEKAPA